MMIVAKFQESIQPPIPQLINLEIEHPFSKESPFCLDGQIRWLDNHAFGGGGFSDVWRGEYQNKVVVIKVIRGFYGRMEGDSIRKLIKV